MLKRPALILLLLTAVFLTAKELPTFEGEEILFSLQQSEQDSTLLLWEVRADLHFSNLHSQPITSMIAFPIPSVDGVSCPVLIELKAISEDADSVGIYLPEQDSETGYSFRLSLPGRSFTTVRIHYTQEVRGDSVSYILSTANSWGRALPSARYRLTVGKGITLKHPPLPEPLLTATPKGLSYSWRYTDYSPSGEFVLHW